MKNKKMIRRFSLVLAVLMLVPMFTFSSAAVETNTLPTAKFYYDSTILDGYYCDSYVYTYSSSTTNYHYTDASIDFYWAGAKDETIYSSEMYYEINHRICYYGYQDFDSISGDVVVYDFCYLDLEDIFVRLNYNMEDADICRYIFGTFAVNNQVVGTIKKYKDVDFALDTSD